MTVCGTGSREGVISGFSLSAVALALTASFASEAFSEATSPAQSAGDVLEIGMIMVREGDSISMLTLSIGSGDKVSFEGGVVDGSGVFKSIDDVSGPNFQWDEGPVQGVLSSVVVFQD